MKKLLIAFSAAALVLSACKKEPSFENSGNNPGGGSGGGGGSTPSGLLSRMVFSDAGDTDSTAYNYEYDAAKRLSFVNFESSNFTDAVRLKRNAAGIITEASIKNEVVTSLGLDSLVIRYNYSTSESRYKSAIFSIPIQGIVFTDSTVLNYDASGNVTSKVTYGGMLGVPFAPQAKMDFTYGNGNIISSKSYTYDNNAWDLEYTFNYTYDNKTNPLRMGVEAVLVDAYISPAFGMSGAIYYGPNNATIIDYIDATDSANNYKLTSSFTYDTSNKPTNGTAVETPGNGSYKWRFYYY